MTPPIKLQDVSIQIDSNDSVDEYVGVWAVDVKGNVLFRHGVTRQCPQVSFAEFSPSHSTMLCQLKEKENILKVL